MRNLKQGLMDQTELTKKRKKAVTEWQLLLFYPLVSDVFLPQQPEPGMETPEFNILVASSSCWFLLIR